MSESPIDAAWVRRACAAQGVRVTPAEAAELAANLEAPLAALDALAALRRYEDEPAGFVQVLARHAQPDPS